MCNHFQSDLEALPTWAKSIDADNTLPMTDIKQDIWPKYQAIIVRKDDGKTILGNMAWGVPLKTKGKRPDTMITKRITNVRNLKSPFWRSMLKEPTNRCLVPFTRFAEPKPNAGREECWFQVTDRPISAFAGIWRPSEEGKVFAFLTCEPNPLVKPIHPKAMPVILHPEDYDKWLNGDPADAFAVPFPSQLMSLIDRN